MMYKQRITFYCFITLLLIINNNAISQETIKLENSLSKLNISESISVINNNNFTPEQAYTIFKTKSDSILEFDKVANFKGHNRGWWLLVSISNSSLNDKEVVLQVRNNYINVAKFYDVTDNFNLIGITGTFVPINERTSLERFINCDISFKPRETKQILVDLSKNTLIKLPTFIYEVNSFKRTSTKDDLFYGIYFGLIITLFIYLFALAIFIKNRMLFVYSLYVISFGFLVFCMTGFVHRFLWTDGFKYLEFIYQDAISLVLITMSFFAVSFLDLKQSLPKFRLFIFLLIGVYLFWYLGMKILGIFGVLNDGISHYLYVQYVFILVFFITLLTTAITNLNYNKVRSNVYLLAYGSLLFFIIVALLLDIFAKKINLHGLNFNDIYEYSYMIGSTIEFTIFTITITKFIQEINLQRINLQKKLIEEERLKLEAYIIAEDKTKEEISRSLHDSTGVQLRYIKTLIQDKENQHSISLSKSVDEIDELSNSIREISHNLSPSYLDLVSIDEAINDLLIKSKSILTTSKFYIQRDFIGDKINNEKSVILYRILNEILNNVIKHSEAKEIWIQINDLDTSLELVVEDNGKGFVYESDKVGFGLQSIQSRMAHIKGTFQIETDVNKGCVIWIKIPY